MRVGQVSLQRGQEAIFRQEPESDRLFKCRSVECYECGLEDHGIPDYISDGWVRNRTCMICERPLNKGEVQPFHCARCGGHPDRSSFNIHYHLSEGSP